MLVADRSLFRKLPKVRQHSGHVHSHVEHQRYALGNEHYVVNVGCKTLDAGLKEKCRRNLWTATNESEVDEAEAPSDGQLAVLHRLIPTSGLVA